MAEEPRSEKSTAEINEAATAIAQALGAAEPGEALTAAIERLTELRAAGLVSEENYVRERRRLLSLDR